VVGVVSGSVGAGARRVPATGLVDQPARLGSCNLLPQPNTPPPKMSAAAAIDFSRLAKLGLARQTQQALAAFRKRATDAQIQAAHLKEAKADVDFAHYRNILKNKAIVEEGEKLIKAFKPVTYDVDAQLKAISAFEGKAVSCTR